MIKAQSALKNSKAHETGGSECDYELGPLDRGETDLQILFCMCKN